MAMKEDDVETDTSAKVRWRLVLEFDGTKESFDLDNPPPLDVSRKAMKELEEYVGGQATYYSFGRV